MSNAPPALLLSVVIPVYNGEKYITECLDSIESSLLNLNAEQRAQVEVIVCDNHSTDQTRAIASARKLSCACRLISPPQHFENRTLNWHHGLSQAAAPWMMMLHADDLMAPSGLSSILNACAARLDGSVVLLWGRMRTFVDPQAPGPLRPRWSRRALMDGKRFRKNVLALHCCFPPFSVMRRRAYLEAGGLNADFQLVQDWDLWLRLLAHGTLCYEPREFCRWRDHPTSAWYGERMAAEHFELGQRLPAIAPELQGARLRAAIKSCACRGVGWLPEGKDLSAVPHAAQDILGPSDSIAALKAAAARALRGTLRRFRFNVFKEMLKGTLRALVG